MRLLRITTETPHVNIERLKRKGLPWIFAVLFLVLWLVTIEQARTIRSQGELIRALLQDSLELSARKVHDVQRFTPKK